MWGLLLAVAAADCWAEYSPAMAPPPSDSCMTGQLVQQLLFMMQSLCARLAPCVLSTTRAGHRSCRGSLQRQSPAQPSHTCPSSHRCPTPSKACTQQLPDICAQPQAGICGFPRLFLLFFPRTFFAFLKYCVICCAATHAGSGRRGVAGQAQGDGAAVHAGSACREEELRGSGGQHQAGAV